MPPNLLAAVRDYVRALDADRVALSAAIEGTHAPDWRPALDSARNLTHAELALRAAAFQEERATTHLSARVREIIANHKPEGKPGEEEYHDTESAYANGVEFEAWTICAELKAALARAGS